MLRKTENILKSHNIDIKVVGHNYYNQKLFSAQLRAQNITENLVKNMPDLQKWAFLIQKCHYFARITKNSDLKYSHLSKKS